MTRDDARALSVGLYRIYWKSGHSSLAAIGSLYNGERWFAAANWTGVQATHIATTRRWHLVDRVTCLTSDTENAVSITK